MIHTLATSRLREEDCSRTLIEYRHGYTRCHALMLSDDLIRKAEAIAAARGESVDAMVGELIEDCPAVAGRKFVPRERTPEEKAAFQEAMKRDFERAERGLDLGFNNRIPWTRDEMHERR